MTGAGFGSFGRQSRLLDPTGPHAQFVHNGFLQALSDGGLLLGAAVPARLRLRGSRARPAAAAQRPGGSTAAPSRCSPAGACCSRVHSAVDFDWSYPSLMAASAVLAATRAGLVARRTGSARRAGTVPRRVALVAVAVLVVASLILAQHAVPGGWLQNAPARPRPPPQPLERPSR